MRRYDGWLPCSLNKHKGLRGCIVACSCGVPLRRHGHDQLKGRSSRNGGGCRGVAVNGTSIRRCRGQTSRGIGPRKPMDIRVICSVP